MSIADNIKRRALSRKSSGSRKLQVCLKASEKVTKLLFVSDKADDDLFKKIGLLFINAEVSHLFERKEKEDQTAQFRYSIHLSDFNLTGVVKNDKLNRLFKTEFDLILDLSQNSDLIPLVINRLSSSLFIGKMNAKNEELYDLFFEHTGSTDEFLKLVIEQLNKLTKR